MATLILLSAEDASAQTVISGNQTTPQIINGSAIVQSGASVATGTATAVAITASNATLTNLGTISNASPGTSATGNPVVRFTAAANNDILVNNGTIQDKTICSGTTCTFGVHVTVLVDNRLASVVNNGTILSLDSAIESNQGISGSFLNSATGQIISSIGSVLVFGTIDHDFTNNGLIQSPFGAAAYLNGNIGGNVVNTGTINSIERFDISGFNCGSFTGFCGTGIFVSGTVIGNVTNTGTILASSTPAVGNDVFGSGIIVAAVGGDIFNSGTITGKNGYGIAVGTTSGGTGGVIVALGNVAGNVTNLGTIASGQTGILVGNVGGALTNIGTIASSSGFGVYVGGSTAAGISNSGLISGATGLYVGGGGANVFDSGTITGTGGTAIQFGGAGNTLVLAAGFAINGNVLGSGTDTLQLGGSGSGVFNAGAVGAGLQYRGFDNFQKTGSGTWTLTGNNLAAMLWTIGAGTLQVNGALPNSAMTVQSSGTLTGAGTVGATQVQAGATFAPGNGTPASSMTVNGSLAFLAGSLFLINASAGSFASVTGTATLGGATVDADFSTGVVSKHYAILTAMGGVSGTFASVVSSNPNFRPTLSYDADNAYLNLALNFAAPGGGNQQTVGNTLVNFFNTTGGIPALYTTLSSGGLSQASGETATATQQTTFDAMNLFLGMMTDPFIDGRGGASYPQPGAPGFAEEGHQASFYAANKHADAYAMFTKAPPAAPFEPRWSVWAAGFGGSQTTDGNAAIGSNAATSRIYGTAAGADYLISPNTVAGFALAGGATNFSVAGSGTGRSDLFQAGAFVRHNAGPAYLSAALAYGWQDITTNRTVTIAGIDQLQARFNANAYSGRAEGGYRFVTPWAGGVGITPYAAAQFTTFDLPAYAERVLSGGGAFALAYGARSVTDTRSELGIRTDKSLAVQNAILTLRGRLAWAHDFNPDRSIGATFQALPGASFVVNGAAQASNAALTTASAELKWTNGWSAAATFEGEFSDVTRSYAGKGVVRYNW